MTGVAGQGEPVTRKLSCRRSGVPFKTGSVRTKSPGCRRTGGRDSGPAARVPDREGANEPDHLPCRCHRHRPVRPRLLRPPIGSDGRVRTSGPSERLGRDGGRKPRPRGDQGTGCASADPRTSRRAAAGSFLLAGTEALVAPSLRHRLECSALLATGRHLQGRP